MLFAASLFPVLAPGSDGFSTFAAQVPPTVVIGLLL